MSVVYLIGSLEGPHVEDVAISLRKQFPGWEFFDEWRGAGKDADKQFNEYRKKRGLSYKDALKTFGASNIFNFDKTHLDRADVVVLVMPAGKSGHLELGYAIGRGKKGYVLFESEPDRIDQMLQFCNYSGGELCFSEEELVNELKKEENGQSRRKEEAVDPSEENKSQGKRTCSFADCQGLDYVGEV